MTCFISWVEINTHQPLEKMLANSNRIWYVYKPSTLAGTHQLCYKMWIQKIFDSENGWTCVVRDIILLLLTIYQSQFGSYTKVQLTPKPMCVWGGSVWCFLETDRCELSWFTGQLLETTITKGSLQTARAWRSAWKYLTDSLLGSLQSLKCDSTASEECWLSAWKHTVALLDIIPLIHFFCIQLCFHMCNLSKRENDCFCFKKKNSCYVITDLLSFKKGSSSI